MFKLRLECIPYVQKHNSHDNGTSQHHNRAPLVAMALQLTGIRTVVFLCQSERPPHLHSSWLALSLTIQIARRALSPWMLTPRAIDCVGGHWPMTGRIEGRRGQGVAGSCVHRKLTSAVLQISGVMSMP